MTIQSLRDRLKPLVPRWLVLNTRFRIENALFAGRDVAAPDAPSVLFFTTAKCASRFIPQAMRLVNSKHMKLRQVNVARYMYIRYADDIDTRLSEARDRLFRPTGFLYAPLRAYVPVRDLDRYRVILMLRDPRDVIVSLYYSMAFSHPAPLNAERRARFVANRERVVSLSVNEYAREMLEGAKSVYSTYCDNLLGRENVTFLRFEEMITDFDGWAHRLGRGLGVQLSGPERKELRRIAKIDVPKTGDVHQHIRQSTPGEYRDKLDEETIARLDSALAPILGALGYGS
jgi:hypothetical protein